MDEKDIEMLLAIQKTHSITHAAELLFINQSSLSKRLQLLERRLHAKLVSRTNQGVQFTPAGEATLQTAREINKLNSDLQETLATDELEVRGTLNLGCSINYAQYELPGLLVAFQKQYPKVRLNITIDYSRTIYQRLLANDAIDVGIIRGEFKGPLRKIPISTEAINLICQKSSDADKLQELPFIQRKTDYHFQDEMNDWLTEHQLSVLTHQTITVNNLTSCVEFVRHGLGWAIVPDIALHNFDGYHQALQLSQHAFTRTTYLMAKANTLNLPVVDAFYEVLMRERQQNKKA